MRSKYIDGILGVEIFQGLQWGTLGLLAMSKLQIVMGVLMTNAIYARATFYTISLVMCLIPSDSDVDRRTYGDSEPTPRVDELEQTFVSDLLKRLKGIEADFRKCMTEVRKMEQGQRRYDKRTLRC